MKGDAFEMWWDQMFDKGRDNAYFYCPYVPLSFNTKPGDKQETVVFKAPQAVTHTLPEFKVDFADIAVEWGIDDPTTYSEEVNEAVKKMAKQISDQVDKDIMAMLAAPTIPSISTMPSPSDVSGFLVTPSADQWTIASDIESLCHKINFYDLNGENSLSIDFDTGEVLLSASMTIDQAAKLFWDRVLEMNPLAGPRGPANPCPGAIGKVIEQVRDEEERKPFDLNSIKATPELLAKMAYDRAMKVVK